MALELKLQLDGLGEVNSHLNPHVVAELLKNALGDIALAMESEARHEGPFKTGNLRRNITRTGVERTAAGNFHVSVGVQRTAPYGVWVHEGTGLYGHRHSNIKATGGNALHFVHGGQALFRRSVRGQRANPFMRRAFVNVNTTYVPARLEKLKREIGGTA